MPVQKGKYSYGIVFLNRRTDGTPSEVSSNMEVFYLVVAVLLQNDDYVLVTF